MIDVKKLITGFLILAVAAVASGLILASIGSFSSSNPSVNPSITGVSNIGGGATPNFGANAFVDTGSIQANAAEILAQTQNATASAIAASSTNLTNVFASSILNGLVQANPGGASLDASGNMNFNAPDTQVVAESIAANPVFSGFQAPDWDKEAAAQPIITEKNPSVDAVSQYEGAITDAFNRYFVTTGLQSALSAQTGDPSQAGKVSTQAENTLKAIVAIPTPPSLVTFQRSLVRTLVYMKNSAANAAESESDPVKAALVMQAEQANFSAAITELQTQEQQASSLGLSFTGTGAAAKAPFLAELFGIRTAHAQWTVFDPANLAELIKTYVEDIILQILKNSLVSIVQQKVLSWIQGSGAPRFVKDFGMQMVSSYESAAMTTINAYSKCVPSGQAQTLMQLITTPQTAGLPIGPAANNPGAYTGFCAAQFQSQLSINGLSQLAYGFTNFNDYLQLFEPGGNIWSSAIQASDAAQAAGSNSQQANQTQNIAQQGWSGSETCADGSSPNGYYSACLDPNTGTTYAINPKQGEKCDPSDIPERLPNNGRCADGSTPSITSPGQVTGQGFFAGLKSGVENITSANNIAGILGALLSSLLNTLANNAINYSQQALTNALNGSGGGGAGDGGLGAVTTSTIGGGNNAATSTPAAPIACFPATQSLTLPTSTTGTATVSASLSASGGAIDSGCAVNNSCPAGVNSDGTPQYSWNATGSVESANGTAITGSQVNITYSAPGTYSVSVTASTDHTMSTCQINVQ